MLEDLIHQTISSNITCHFLDVNGDGTHFEAVVVSDAFKDKSRLERHRLIYSALGDKMRNQIHALSMKLYTITEWTNING